MQSKKDRRYVVRPGRTTDEAGSFTYIYIYISDGGEGGGTQIMMMMKTIAGGNGFHPSDPQNRYR